MHVKFIYSEKATKFCEIFTLILTTLHTYSQKQGEDFAKFCAFAEYMNFIFFVYFLQVCTYFYLKA